MIRFLMPPVLLILMLSVLPSSLSSAPSQRRPRRPQQSDAAHPSSASSAPRSSLPNVVLVMADDQGWGDVGFNFPNSRDTPFLDELASRSFVGLDHHSGASVCSPSRAALLTGRLGARTGVWRNFDSVALGGLVRLSRIMSACCFTPVSLRALVTHLPSCVSTFFLCLYSDY